MGWRGLLTLPKKSVARKRLAIIVSPRGQVRICIGLGVSMKVSIPLAMESM